MRTVKELAALAGISARTLHYYDEIGLLRPSVRSAAGYRLYDDKALERLRRILFFRELDIPLGQIRAVLDSGALDETELLWMQRRMLAAKAERIGRLIGSIDAILKGEDTMDFTVFTKTEIDELFDRMARQLPDGLRRMSEEEFGGPEGWRSHYRQAMARPEMQKVYQKMFEWYGGKEEYLGSVRHPLPKELLEGFMTRLEDILARLAQKRGCPPDSFEVRQLAGEYAFIYKRMLGAADAKPFMLALAHSLEEEKMRAVHDERHGAGAAEFTARAIRAYYREDPA